MRGRSFRFRLALISMGLSGLVLLVFGLVAWWALSQSQIRALDHELTTFGYRFVSRSGPSVSGKRQEEILVSMVGNKLAPHRFFAILNQREAPLFQSAHWPDGLDPIQFSAGDSLLNPQPEVIRPSPKPGERKQEPRLRPIYEPRFYVRTVEGHRYRIGAFQNAEVVLVAGADLNQFSRDVLQLRNAFLLALPAALAVIALGAWWLGRKALKPIKILGEDMSTLSARDLGQRLESGGADIEFARIIETYNDMLERLERSFDQANRFSGDASHELKTPLAIMRATLERGLNRSHGNPETQEVFSRLLEQSDRQSAILESLLLLSRADAGRLEISPGEIDLSNSLEVWLEDAGLLAESREISIESEIEPGIEISGDAILLQQAAHNLFSNAVRYNEENGRINSQLVRTGHEAEWKLANTGDPIPESDRDRIFGRFEKANSKNLGVGLGLSLTKEIILAHQGSISVGENAAGMVEMRVRLPLCKDNQTDTKITDA